MQITKYPLPPLFLGEVLDRAKADHTHQCDDYCRAEPSFCSRGKADNHMLLDVPEVVEIKEGNGRHQCDQECADRIARRGKCLEHCADSDWIVEVRYSENGWHAIYGIKRHGDVQDVSLWAD